ncbi:hypothetical protein V0U79_02840 [Hyphobacterium sp. HN65]|uniref:Uncharacterized protein n=1 Tax=Hyphobacterium lacteum TaxID=3116575 RepID=A0ABU7LN11_9PROT|nr:hypothetical protein [Hyphobacterium sp. HN65]MEE2525287.1 hypothetical protein [Hyphobacterium sp. HN65]
MNETLNNMSRGPIGGVIVTVLRMIGVALGLALMFISLPLAIVTPFVPVGLPLFVFGLLMLAGSSARAHRVITGFLKRHPGLWQRVRKLFGDKDEDENPTRPE